MYYVYVLRSKKNGRQYVGFTGKKVQERLIEHNCGSNKFTKENRPYELIYSEEHKDKEFAGKRERFFKTGNGRRVLKKLLFEKN